MRGDDSPVACFTGFDKLPSLHAQLVTNTRTFAHSHSGSVFSLHLSIELAVSVTHTHTHCQCVGFGWCRLLCWVRRKPSPKLNLSSCRCLCVCACVCVHVHACLHLWSDLLVGLLYVYNYCIQTLDFCGFHYFSDAATSMNYWQLLEVSQKHNHTLICHSHTMCLLFSANMKDWKHEYLL